MTPQGGRLSNAHTKPRLRTSSVHAHSSHTPLSHNDFNFHFCLLIRRQRLQLLSPIHSHFLVRTRGWTYFGGRLVCGLAGKPRKRPYSENRGSERKSSGCFVHLLLRCVEKKCKKDLFSKSLSRKVSQSTWFQSGPGNERQQSGEIWATEGGVPVPTAATKRNGWSGCLPPEELVPRTVVVL